MNSDAQIKHILTLPLNAAVEIKARVTVQLFSSVVRFYLDVPARQMYLMTCTIVLLLSCPQDAVQHVKSGTANLTVR